MNTFDLLAVVAPVFLVIGAGFFASKIKLMSEQQVSGVMVFIQNFAVPALLFSATAKMDLAQSFAPNLLLSFYIPAFLTFVLGVTGASILLKQSGEDAVTIGFAALFANVTFLGLPISARAIGADALGSNFALLSVHAPFCYFLGVVTMELMRAKGASAKEALHLISGSLIGNPLVMSTVLGLTLNLSELTLPEALQAAIDMIGLAALPAALFGLGGVLARYRISDSIKETTFICVLSLLLHPAMTLILTRSAFPLPQAAATSALITAAMAPGVNAYVFASIFQRRMGVVASAILIGTVLSIFTVTFWLLLA